MHQPTPCVGICSTTYGDLVCRGCKRFAHEIVQWNGYSEAQRDQIRDRLADLHLGSAHQYFRVTDADALLESMSAQLLGGAPVPRPAAQAVELLWLKYLRRRPQLNLTFAGIQFLDNALTPEHPAAALCELVDAEFLRRSRALYEHNFKVPAV